MQRRPVPFGERRVLADALVPTEVIDEYHGHLHREVAAATPS